MFPGAEGGSFPLLRVSDDHLAREANVDFIKRAAAMKPHWKPLLLQIYRLAVVFATLLLIRHHFQYLKIQGDSPITVSEVQSILPEAASLRIDTGPRAGLFVDDAAGNEIGYALRTSPQADEIIGYAGPSDLLIVLGKPTTTPNPPSANPLKNSPEEKSTEPTRKILGIKIRHSWDTRRHIQWVKDDSWFMGFWQGRDWKNISSLDFYEEYMEGVSGATLSSMGIARSIQHRFRIAEENRETGFQIRVSHTDYGLWISICIGLLITFRSGWRHRKNLWLGLKIAAFIYIGFLNGSLIAISLLAGYAAHGIAWQLAPGLTSLVLLSFFIPWATRRQPYCNHLCPHGAAQQLLSRYSPWKRSFSPRAAAGLKWLPFFLIVIAVSFLVLQLPLEFSHLEPFDAYLFRQSDWIPIIIAVVSLAISAVVPMAFCKYGCPSGALLEYVRSHGRADRFRKRDIASLFLLILTWLLINQYNTIHNWLAQ